MQKRWIWPFELEEKLGEGGMGVVYRARYVVDDRRLALKLLPPDVANATILSRFEREMEILKTLRHPNIVKCFGGTCEGDQRFYAMELVEGGTLDRVIEDRGRLPWELAVEYGVQMASALAYAHERGVVHRDIKPGNFLLTNSGKLKLSDFGLATVIAASKITAAGRTMGTFPYMAPEQIRGRPPISAQSDLYALGCVLFEMVGGRPPFVGETPAEVMHKHLQEMPPRITEIEPGCPSSLEALIGDLLKKDPEQRPQNAYIVARRLKDVTPMVEVTYPPPAGIDRIPIDEEEPMAAAAVAAPKEPPPALSYERGWFLPICVTVVLVSLVWGTVAFWPNSGANKAEELWIRTYKGNNLLMSTEAARALGELTEHSPTALNALIEGLDDQRLPIRVETVRSLGRAGSYAEDAIPHLSRIQQKDQSGELRYEAGKAIESIRASREGRSNWQVYVGAAITLAVLSGLFILSRWR